MTEDSVTKHAVRHGDISTDIGGKGKYKRWLPSAMLKASCLGQWLGSEKIEATHAECCLQTNTIGYDTIYWYWHWYYLTNSTLIDRIQNIYQSIYTSRHWCCIFLALRMDHTLCFLVGCSRLRYRSCGSEWTWTWWGVTSDSWRWVMMVVVPRPRFGWSGISAIKRKSDMARRSMTSMALRSIAYWMEAGHTTVSKATWHTGPCAIGYKQ